MKLTRTRPRWGDNDKNFGPFTYARDFSWRPFGVLLRSGCDEHPGCALRFSGFGHTFIINLPPIIEPHRVKVFPNWDVATVARLGRNWYYDETEREYGFSLSDGYLNVRYGRQSHNSSTEQSWGYFLPWTQWRFVRYSLFDLDGNHLWTEPTPRNGLSYEEWRARWDEKTRQKELVPKMRFKLIDFDGEEIIATTYIEEREWRFGEKWCSWLSWFRKPKIRRSLNIKFDKEVGPRKGSWKGGTLGHSAEIERYETGAYQGPMLAMMLYCERENMTFVGMLPWTSTTPSSAR